jgi:mannose-6-phosphate isomerase-like protein (cupin superfamily)
MRKGAPAILAVVFLVTQAVISSQSAMPPRTATDITSVDVRAVIAKAPPDGIQDQQIRVVDMGKYNVAVGVLHRSAKPAQQGAIDHAQVTEVYHIIEGSGTLVLGPDIIGMKRRPSDSETVRLFNGPGNNGASVRNGVTYQLKAGDVVVIPAGTGHWFTKIDDHITYLMVRIDPDKVTPLRDEAASRAYLQKPARERE